LKILGLLVDANGEPERRWQAVRDRCLPSIDDLPAVLPENGLILHHAIFQHILAPAHPKGDAFFAWFVELFGLDFGTPRTRA
jgi:hypothetical protein